jgi:penicillin-binding protein 1A
VWVGYDSRESLGEKETGARAALPIWMEIMKVAIAGKDDEQFPGDTEQSPMEQAKAIPPPAKPISTLTPATHPSVTPAQRPQTPATPPRTAAPPVAKPVQTGLGRPVSPH